MASQPTYGAIRARAPGDAAAGAADQLFIAAAGNAGSNTDTSPHYPSSYDLPNIISVAATDQHDELSLMSNYGLESVDLAAPGVGITNTETDASYGSRTGTSMASTSGNRIAAVSFGGAMAYPTRHPVTE